MKLAFRDYEVCCRRWETERQLLTGLAGCRVGTLVLGEEAEDPQQYDELVVRAANGATDEEPLRIAIISGAPALEPALLPIGADGTLLIGHNSQIAVVDVEARRIAWTIDCAGVFFCFVDAVAAGVILAIHELGVVGLDGRGAELWGFTDDILTSWRLDGQRIELQFYEGRRVRLNVRTGVRIRS